MTEAPEETIALPPGERENITRMADSFKAAMAKVEPTAPSKPAQPVRTAQQQTPKPAEQKPAAAEPAEPSQAPTGEVPAAIKGEARKHFARLEEAKAKAEREAASLKAELEKITKGDAEIPEFPKTHKDWAILKGIKDRFQKDAEAAKTELEKFKAGGNPTELENLRAQLQEREKILASVAVEKMPEFRSHFAQRFQTVISEAAEAVGPEHAAKVSQVFGMPAGAEREKAFEALAGEVGDVQKIGLVSSFQNWKRTEKDREAELAKAPQTIKAITEENSRREKEAELQAIRQRAALVSHITAQIEPELAGAEPEQANAIRANVKKFVDGGDAELFVSTMTAAAKWQRHEKAFREQSEELAKLKAQLAEIQESTPSLRSTGRTDRRPPPPPLDNSDIGEKFRRARDGGSLRRAA